MSQIRNFHKFVSFIVVGCALLLFPSLVIGEEYRIGANDVLQVSFWQDPKLNSEVRVGEDGKITLNIIGQIVAANKSTLELQNDIVQKMSRLNKNISQAVVRVTSYNYNYVFVVGQVNTPGKKTFESIPDLWTIINESGGAGDFADLSRVIIIRGGENAGEVEVVNVTQLLASGQLSKLPKIRRTDTIEIPRAPANLPAGGLIQPVERKNILYVLGAVTRPGPVQFEENIDILELLALAGGPTADADLKKVRIVSKDGNYARTIHINLDKYSKTGKPARYIMQKEDTFIVPRKSSGIFGLPFPTILAAIGTLTTTILLIDRLGAQ